MKSYSVPVLLVIVLGAGASIGMAILAFLSKNKKIFVRNTILHLLCAVLIGALTGLSGYLLKKNLFHPTTLYILLEIDLIALGSLHVWAMYQFSPWSRREGFQSEFPFTLLVSLLGAIGFFFFYRWLGVGDYAPVFVTAFIFLPLVFLVIKAYDFWMAIPSKIYKPWYLPIDAPPAKIERVDQYKDLVFHIPVTRDSPQVAEFKIRSPLNKNLGDLFCYLVYRHNEQEKLDPTIPDIEIAENHRRDKLYGWLFFSENHQLKEYLNPDENINQVLHNATNIFVERVTENGWK